MSYRDFEGHPDQDEQTGSQDAEWSVIGGLLIDQSAFDRIAVPLTAAHFAHAHASFVFEAITRTMNARQPVDIVTVGEALDADGKLRTIGGMSTLSEMAWNTPSAANIGRYAEMVYMGAMRRAAIGIAGQLSESLAHGMGIADPVAVISQHVGELSSLTEVADADDETMTAAEIAQAALTRIDDTFNNGKDARPSIPSSLASLDAKLNAGGFHAGNLVIIAGRPAMGKTVLAMNIADAIATPGHRNGGHVLVFSLEMNSDQLGDRMLASQGAMSLESISNADMENGGWDKLTVGINKASELQQTVVFRSGLTIQQVISKARQIRRKHGRLAAVVIDYLQLLAMPNRKNKADEVGDVTRSLKVLAKELHCPVIVLSQLSRKVEERADKRPLMSDLRDSGAIEQDADTILTLYRDEYYDPDSDHKGIVEIGIVKQRQGECGIVKAAFQGQYSRIVDLAHDWQAPVSQKPAKAKSSRWEDE